MSTSRSIAGAPNGVPGGRDEGRDCSKPLNDDLRYQATNGKKVLRDALSVYGREARWCTLPGMYGWKAGWTKDIYLTGGKRAGSGSLGRF